MGAQQAKERERTASSAGSIHSLTLSSGASSRQFKSGSKTNSLRPARDNSSSARSQAFNVFMEHNGTTTAATTSQSPPVKN